MGNDAGQDEEGDRHSQNEPQERCPDVVGVIGDAVESPEIGLIFDDELLKDQGFGKRDHRAIDAVYMPLEGDDAENEREYRRNDQGANHCKGCADQRSDERRQLLESVPLHEVGKLAAVAGRMLHGVVDLQRQGDKIGAHAEIDRLAEAEDSRIAPDQVDAESEDRKAKELSEQRQDIAVVASIVGNRSDRGDDEKHRAEGPRSGSSATFAHVWKELCPSPPLVITKYAARKDANGDHDRNEYQELADDRVVFIRDQCLALADEEGASRHAEQVSDAT